MVRAGQSAKFNCTVTEPAKNVSQWQKMDVGSKTAHGIYNSNYPNRSKINYPRVSVERSSDREFNLVIESTTLNDAGKYLFQQDDRDSVSALLVVIGEPR